MRAKKRHYPWQSLNEVGSTFLIDVATERREMTRKALHTAARQKGMRVAVRVYGPSLLVERTA